MPTIIINPFTSIPKSEKSHVRGWSMVWSQKLAGATVGTKDADLSNYDKICIDHGVNFSGSMNLFGGFNDEVANRVLDLINAWKNGAKIYSLDHDVAYCNYTSQVEKRVGAKTTSDLVDFDFLEDLENMLTSAETLHMNHIGLSTMILGDSHSVAYSGKTDVINRINGQLLYSAMKTTIHDFILGYDPSNYKHITLCLGSIDIRFHALQDERMSAKEFATKYAEQVIDAQERLGVNISVCAPVPIEFEERRLPKTGQYNGVNFTGSRDERLAYTMEFIETLDSYCCDFDLIMPPKEWYEMDGEKYAKDIMELSSSVHVAPKNYRSIINWNK
jgi:hypothetical protein